MKWALACALALAVTNTAAALTLPSGTHTSLGTAVTVSSVSPAPASDDLARLHPHRVAAAPVTSWKVKPGQSLSSIAGKAYGSTSLWPALWWINKAAIRNPNLITAGQVIKLSRWHPDVAWLDHAALRAIPAPPPPVRHVVLATSSTGRHVYRGTVSYHQGTYRTAPRMYRAPSSTYRGSGGMESCIISRESGGNSQVMNSSGHYGLYQFSYSTWVGSGGSGASFGHASVAQQQQVFHNAVAARGYSDWRAYDGC